MKSQISCLLYIYKIIDYKTPLKKFDDNYNKMRKRNPKKMLSDSSFKNVTIIYLEN